MTIWGKYIKLPEQRPVFHSIPRLQLINSPFGGDTFNSLPHLTMTFIKELIGQDFDAASAIYLMGDSVAGHCIVLRHRPEWIYFSNILRIGDLLYPL